MSRDSQPALVATVVATGVTADGNREIWDVMSATAGAKGFWQQFLVSLRHRSAAVGLGRLVR